MLTLIIQLLTENKKNSKYSVGYPGDFIRTLVLILPKITRYIKTFKVKDEDKDKIRIIN